MLYVSSFSLFSPLGELQYLSKLGLISKFIVNDIVTTRPLRNKNIPKDEKTENPKKIEKVKEDDGWDDLDDDDVDVEVGQEGREEVVEENEEVIRLDLELFDLIESLTNQFIELGSICTLPSHLSGSRNVSGSGSGSGSVSGVSGSSSSSSGGGSSSGNKQNDIPTNKLNDSNKSKDENKIKDENKSKEEAMGIVARSVKSFLQNRKQQQDTTSGNNTGSGSGSGNSGNNSSSSGSGLGFLTANLIPKGGEKGSERGSERGREDDILSAFELIESPLKIMKRAGLDLLSTGWGR